MSRDAKKTVSSMVSVPCVTTTPATSSVRAELACWTIERRSASDHVKLPRAGKS